jgi:lipoprotein-anchoring transpeptidase ErfK/SrfK
MGSVSDTPLRGGTLTRVRPVRSTIAAMASVMVLSACGGADAHGAVEVVSAPAPVPTGAPPTAPVTTLDLRPPSTSTSSTTSTVPSTEPDPVSWTAAKAKYAVDVFQAPGDGAPSRVLATHTILGTPTVVLVLGGSDAWLEVLLPGRPNGDTGWIRAVDVERFEVQRQAVIDLNARVLHVLDGDELIFETIIGVGSPSSPTPVGMYFVTDAVRITNPNGPWGPYAFGLSARSDTVTEFNGGDGIIGIHGTNRPNSIGEAQSLGCVRIPNDVMLELAELLSVGSPVTIKA